MIQLPIHSMQDLVVAGDILGKTDIVGARNSSEGFTIACICHQQGITYAQFAETYHLVFGRISKRADAMLADLVRMGGTYKVKARTADKASIEISFGGNKQTFTLTWADTQEETFPYKKDGRALKEQYSTPRGRTQMMWARVLSDGIRAICPQANAGYYTPEEVEDFAAPEIPAVATTVIDVPATEVAPAPAAVPAEAAPANAYHSCPMDGPLMGVAWAEMPNDHLEAALVAAHSDMSDGHRAQIRAILEQRAAA